MDEEDDMAALQNQAELEQRMLGDDPDYENWLEQLNYRALEVEELI